MWRKFIEFITFGKTERMLLYVSKRSHSVSIRQIEVDGKDYIRISVHPLSTTLPSTHVTVSRREGIYPTLRNIAKYSLTKIQI